MDCKNESTARTFLRTSLILEQGIVFKAIGLLVVVLCVPFIPFAFAIGASKGKGATGFVCIPLYFLKGVLIAVLEPFRFIVDAIRQIGDVAVLEWVTRWQAAEPKLPNGKPYTPPIY